MTRRVKEDHDKGVLDFIMRRDNWMSEGVQSEMIELCGRYLQEKIMEKASASAFLGVVADGTTDISGDEQLSICLQYLTENLDVESAFLGFFNAPSSTGETLTKVVLDVLTRFGISVSKLSGFSFDTAANMSGVHRGVQARLKELSRFAV